MRTLLVILLCSSAAAAWWPWGGKEVKEVSTATIDYDRAPWDYPEDPSDTNYLPRAKKPKAKPREKRNNDDRKMVDDDRAPRKYPKDPFITEHPPWYENHKTQPREKRHHDDRWMVDVAYNEHRDQWYKYDCRRVCYLEECSGTQGGTFKNFDCFKPAEHNVRHFHLNDGWHKLLTCKATSDTDYVVLSADKRGTPVTIGAGSASKMIRCNDRGKWVTKTDRGKEVEVRNAFCYVVPKVEL
ncbi:hypothetical protein Y032_0148g2647 [Ancylostoma ceylanicum]|uniref:Uncharacterized protein n=1 Tax=Ancylostoma ceylanicum TaxID=53326 RepID=A0A016T1U7_9BILA|nr:hypothetical protein Y032_0148g2647 [Ancylostoma ceylanicum]